MRQTTKRQNMSLSIGGNASMLTESELTVMNAQVFVAAQAAIED